MEPDNDLPPLERQACNMIDKFLVAGGRLLIGLTLGDGTPVGPQIEFTAPES